MGLMTRFKLARLPSDSEILKVYNTPIEWKGGAKLTISWSEEKRGEAFLARQLIQLVYAQFEKEIGGKYRKWERVVIGEAKPKPKPKRIQIVRLINWYPTYEEAKRIVEGRGRIQ